MVFHGAAGNIDSSAWRSGPRATSILFLDEFRQGALIRHLFRTNETTSRFVAFACELHETDRRMNRELPRPFP